MFEPEVLVFMIPIIAIIMGMGTRMLKTYYKHKEKMMGHMSVDQMAELGQMSKLADILDQRVNVLERILDDEVPTWRETPNTQTHFKGGNDDKTI